ncbi:unnamed protein product, partial [Ixodes pacificus]
MTDPLLLFVQVGNKTSYCTVKDNSLTLLVLPSPRSLIVTCSECWGVLLLLLQLSGDVELNPGPTEEMLRQILDNQQTMSVTLNNIQSKQVLLENSLGAVQTRLSLIETNFESLNKNKERIDENETQIRNLLSHVVKLGGKIDYLENASRRNNIVIYGLREDEKEDPRELQQTVTEGIFSAKLQVEVKTIERIHRIGRKIGNRPRPVILSVNDFNEKMRVLRNCFKLKGSVISISEDFSHNVRAIRKNLWQSAAVNKANGDKVTLIFDKLKINNDLYSWD